MSVDTNEFIRVTVYFTVPNGSVANCVFWYRNDSAEVSNSEVLQDFDFWVTDVFGPLWQDFANVGSTITGVTIDRINNNGTVAENIGSDTYTIAGTQTGSADTPVVAGYVKADTPRPKSRGSKYFPGVGQAQVSGGLFDSETLADLALLLVFLVDVYSGDTSTADWVPGILSRVLSQWIDYSGGGSTTQVPAYQRRRKPNVGS